MTVDSSPNPFLQWTANVFSDSAVPERAPTHRVSKADSGSRYRLVKSGPAVDKAEVELAHVSAVEIMIFWGDSVLHVDHLTPPRNFYVGEAAGKAAVDFHVPAEKLGTTRMPLVVVTAGSTSAVIPAAAKGTIDLPGKGSLDLEQARAAGLLRPCSEHSEAEQIELPEQGRTRIEVNGFVFQIGVVPAGRKVKRELNRSSRAGLFFAGVSAMVHLGLVAGLMYSPGASLDDESAGLDKSTLAYIVQMQQNAAGPEIPEDSRSTAGAADDKSGGTGAAHRGANGSAGDPSKAVTNGHYAIKGPPDTPAVAMARVRAQIESESYGALGALASVFRSSAHAPIAFDSDADISMGRDRENFLGALQGNQAGDNFGMGGLDTFGSGPGGGGLFDGIGIGRIGDFGNGSGTGTGSGYGAGFATGGAGRPLRHDTKPLRVIEPAGVDTSGRLPPEAIKRIVRANFPRFRQCYEQGLKRDPGLRGTVSTRFIIDSTGAVESVNLSASTMPDSAVSACVLGVYRSLSFPEPEGGKVMVTYPIDFQNDT